MLIHILTNSAWLAARVKSAVYFCVGYGTVLFIEIKASWVNVSSY